jgi:IS30 family transposase
MYNPCIDEIKHLEKRRNQCPNLKMTAKAWELIKPKLELWWSREQGAPWLETSYPEQAMSGKTLYTSVFFYLKGELKKWALQDLRLRGKARKQGRE